MWKQIILPLVISVLAIFGVKISKQPINYAEGVYTNLCGSGLSARLHWCSRECNADIGVCSSTKNWVVKWTCDGKLTSCTDNEVWGHSENLANNVCGKTVTIDVFDRNCRENGWSCNETNLKDYLVWYSGDCVTSGSAFDKVNAPSTTPQVTILPRTTIMPKIMIRPTVLPIFVPVTASASAVAKVTPNTGDNRWIWGLLSIGALAFGIILWDNADHII